MHESKLIDSYTQNLKKSVKINGNILDILCKILESEVNECMKAVA